MKQLRQLQQYDPSTLDSIQFNVKNVKKYTSIVSIILSLLIVTLTVILNIDTLREIYAPRKDLYINQVHLKDSQSPLSDQLICVTLPPPLTVNGYLYINYKKQDGAYANKTIQTLTQLKNFSYMQTQIGSNNFQCYNLKGNWVKISDQIRFYGQIKPGFRFLVSTINLDRIIDGLEPQVLIFDDTTLTPSMDYLINMRFYEFILKDRLLVNYQPEVIYGIGDQLSLVYPGNLYLSSYSTISLNFRGIYQIDKQVYIGSSFTIYRKNISQIIGNLLAWRGIILIPIAIVLLIFPIVQQLYKLDLIKARYQSQVINKLNFNLLTDIKRKISRICPNLFPNQRVIDKAIQSIQEQLDLVGILQIQSIMRRQRLQFNQIQREEDIFDCKIQQKDLKIDVLLQNTDNDLNSNLTTHSIGKATRNSKILQKNEQQDKFCLVDFLRSLIISFDSTDIKISISTNQGKGYGSIASMCSFILLGAGILFVFVLLGIFNFGTNKESINMQSIQDQQLRFTLPDYSFAAKFSTSFSGYTLRPKIQLVDSKNNAIKTFDLVTNAKCEQVGNMMRSESNWYCIGQNVELSSIQNKQVKLRITLDSTPLMDEAIKNFVRLEMVYAAYDQYKSKYAQYVQTRLGYVGAYHTIKKVVHRNDQGQQQTYQFQNLQKRIEAESQVFVSTGKSYKLIIQENYKIWNILNDVWGIVIIACELIIFRVGRYINMKILSSRINTDKQNKRSDILTILFDIDRLSKGIYKQELASVGFYYKHKLPQPI